jgi:hypothetical protein
VNGEWISFKDTTNATRWHMNNKSGGLNFAQTSVADGRLFLGTNGNVGIGTTTPVAALDVAGTVRMGSGTGTAEAPSPANGLVIRRINSTSTTSGSIVAVCPLALNTNLNFTLVRDGTGGGFQLNYPVSPGGEILTIACMGIDATGTQRNFYTSVSIGGGINPGSIAIYNNSLNIVHFECTFGDMDHEGDHTKVTLTRAATQPANFETTWTGDIISTHNQ